VRALALVDTHGSVCSIDVTWLRWTMPAAR
jgi:hypothetical protein